MEDKPKYKIPRNSDDLTLYTFGKLFLTMLFLFGDNNYICIENNF
jgi:hypothetical protein